MSLQNPYMYTCIYAREQGSPCCHKIYVAGLAVENPEHRQCQHLPPGSSKRMAFPNIGRLELIVMGGERLHTGSMIRFLVLGVRYGGTLVCKHPKLSHAKRTSNSTHCTVAALVRVIARTVRARGKSMCTIAILLASVGC